MLLPKNKMHMNIIISKARITDAYRRVHKHGATHDECVRAAAIATVTDELIVAEVIAEKPAGWLETEAEATHA